MVEYCAYWLAGWVSRTIPRHFAYWLSLRLADLYFFFDRRAREAVMANLRQVMAFKGRHPTEQELRLTTRTTFQFFGKYLVDYFRFSRLAEDDIRRLVTIENVEFIEQARQDGKGVILVTAHLGNWELGGAAMAGMGYPLNVVTMHQPSAKLNDFFQKHRRRRGMNVVPHGHAVKQLLLALRRNEFIALLADRDYSRRNDFASLCGAQACLPRGAAWLAEKTGAVILPGFMLRKEDDTFLLKLYPPVRFGDGMTQDELQRKICETLEDAIGGYPHQWFMFERVWDGLSYGAAASQTRDDSS